MKKFLCWLFGHDPQPIGDAEIRANTQLLIDRIIKVEQLPFARCRRCEARFGLGGIEPLDYVPMELHE